MAAPRAETLLEQAGTPRVLGPPRDALLARLKQLLPEDGHRPEMPISLERQHLDALRRARGVTVAAKADGLRAKLVLLTLQGAAGGAPKMAMALVTNDDAVWAWKGKASQVSFEDGVVFDAEVVRLFSGGFAVMVFDALYDRGPLPKGPERAAAMRRRLRDCELIPPEGFKLLEKPVFPLAEAAELWRGVPYLDYAVDGLVINTSGRTYKWKHAPNVDLRVTATKHGGRSLYESVHEAASGTWVLQEVGQGMVLRGRPCPVRVVDSRPLEQCPPSEVVSYDVSGDPHSGGIVLTFHEARPDKRHPNTHKTVESCVESALNRITPAEIAALHRPRDARSGGGASRGRFVPPQNAHGGRRCAPSADNAVGGRYGPVAPVGFPPRSPDGPPPDQRYTPRSPEGPPPPVGGWDYDPRSPEGPPPDDRRFIPRSPESGPPPGWCPSGPRSPPRAGGPELYDPCFPAIADPPPIQPFAQLFGQPHQVVVPTAAAAAAEVQFQLSGILDAVRRNEDEARRRPQQEFAPIFRNSKRTR